MNSNNSVTFEQNSYSKSPCYDTDCKQEFKGKNFRALIIDDNAVNRLVAKNLLRLLGAIVEEAVDSIKAIELILNHPFDIILMDYLMPDMNGLELTKWIRELRGEKGKTPIIGISADSSENIRMNFIKAGAIEVLKKPIELQDLREVINGLLIQDVSFDKTIEPFSLVREEEVGYQTKTRVEFIRDEIKKIPEIDYNLGLHYAMGDALAYMKIIKVSVISMEQNRIKMKNHRNEDNKLALNREFHCVKSVLMHIGAVDLANQVAKIEETDSSLCHWQEKTDTFIAQLEQLLIALEHAIEAYNILDSNEKHKEKLKLLRETAGIEYSKVSILNAVIYHAKRFEYELMLDHLKVWNSYAMVSEEEQVKKAILAAERFEYKRVISIIEEVFYT